MGRLSSLIASSTGLKITYAGFAAYAFYTLMKYCSVSAEDSIIMTIIAGAGTLGSLAAIISMVVTGIRRARQGRKRMLWSIWACIGCLPLAVPSVLALVAATGSIGGSKVELQPPIEQEKIKMKIEEIKAKSPRSPALPMLSRIYAEDRYRYRGEIIDYVDKDFKTVKYEPNEKIRKEREFWTNLPERTKAARSEGLFVGGVAFSILMISVLAGFFSRIDRTSNTPLEPPR